MLVRTRPSEDAEEALQDRVLINVEIKNLAAFMTYARALPNYAAGVENPEEDAEGCLLSSVSEIFCERGYGDVPGFSVEGTTTSRVEWFEHDHILDKRHPNYVEPAKTKRAGKKRETSPPAAKAN